MNVIQLYEKDYKKDNEKFLSDLVTLFGSLPFSLVFNFTEYFREQFYVAHYDSVLRESGKMIQIVDVPQSDNNQN